MKLSVVAVQQSAYLSIIDAGPPGLVTKSRKESIMSFFGNMGRKMVAAREKQVRRYVNNSLLSFDDATLKNAGFDRETLKRNSSPFIY